MSTGWSVFTILLLVFFVVVALFGTAVGILVVRQRLTNGRSKQGKSDVEAVKYDDFKPVQIPSPMAAYFPHAYRHQMDMEVYNTTAAPPPLPRPVEKAPTRENRHHRHPSRLHRQSRRLL
ncbi:hypothetical protein L218DRAFT_1078197 [Marasmius fiardii PR-910]|nr:hypothetical protein L218DRAFT_1078197 [Marasmius fiardii PR-910]